MSMIGLKAFWKASSPCFMYNAHAGACQEQAEDFTCFVSAHADLFFTN